MTVFPNAYCQHHTMLETTVQWQRGKLIPNATLQPDVIETWSAHRKSTRVIPYTSVAVSDTGAVALQSLCLPTKNLPARETQNAMGNSAISRMLRKQGSAMCCFAPRYVVPNRDPWSWLQRPTLTAPLVASLRHVTMNFFTLPRHTGQRETCTLSE